MRTIKKIIRKIFPEEIISWWHWCQTILAAIYYRFPSRSMIIIGVTGSKGKTTTSNMIWAALSSSGAKVGQTGTANIRIGDTEKLNPYHMTMPGRWHLQKIIHEMRNAGCKYAVIETPSEGQKHYRHAGINYDVLLFTNLTDEHLPIHHNNSFEQLKHDNGRVFRKLHRQARKSIDGTVIQKTIIVNNDAKDSPYYAANKADKHLSYGVKQPADFKASHIKSSIEGTQFIVNEVSYNLPILGSFNVTNATAAIAVASELGINPQSLKKGLEELTVIPGRMEVIDEGQEFKVIVDYAHEPVGLQLLLSSAQTLKNNNNNSIIIHLGAEGGGRDKEKRPEMGKIAAQLADIVIIGNVDPYDDDPAEIIDEIADGAMKAGKINGKNLYLIEDRRAGIRKALESANQNDLVLITGKGAEQSFIKNGKKTPWDDRDVVREELRKLMIHHE